MTIINLAMFHGVILSLLQGEDWLKDLKDPLKENKVAHLLLADVSKIKHNYKAKTDMFIATTSDHKVVDPRKIISARRNGKTNKAGVHVSNVIFFHEDLTDDVDAGAVCISVNFSDNGIGDLTAAHYALVEAVVFIHVSHDFMAQDRKMTY